MSGVHHRVTRCCAARLSRLPAVEGSGLRRRAATAADTQAIGQITTAAYVAGGHLTPQDSYFQTLLDVAPRLEHTWVMVDAADEIVAAIAILPDGHPLGEAAEPGEWEFRFLAVRADHWGRGLGRELVAFAEDQARVGGARGMALRVIDTNPRARELYEHLGYQHAPERDITFESSTEPGRMLTLLLLAKPLG